MFNNIVSAREILESLVKVHAKQVDLWLEYITIERYLGGEQSITNSRTLFKRAIHAVKDYPERIYGEWLSFESESGNIETYEVAQDRIYTTNAKIMEMREKEMKVYMEKVRDL